METRHEVKFDACSTKDPSLWKTTWSRFSSRTESQNEMILIERTPVCLDRSSYETYDDSMFSEHTHQNTKGDRIATSSDRLGNTCSTLSSVSICNRSATSSMDPNRLISRSDDEEFSLYISNIFDFNDTLSSLSRMYPMILWFLDPSMNTRFTVSDVVVKDDDTEFI